MINIKNKADCVGCNACVQRCPKQCISMTEDEQGFLYPHVDVSKCIECGLCERVCPVINQSVPREPLAAHAAKNKNEEVCKNSSSGGVFYALAKYVIEQGGIVFGARFNSKWEVVHDFTKTIEGIQTFQTSKYVQSRIGETYLQAEQFLKDGKLVLFSGTPCQIIGLKHFLRKDYDNLLAIDFICHGVPSPLVWRKYLELITRPSDMSKITDSQSDYHNSNYTPSILGISFRDKRLGWEKFGFAIHYAVPKCDINSDSQSSLTSLKEEKLSDFFEPHRENLFMLCFLKNLCLRPSCYRCPTKCGKSHSDITLADFWGIKISYPQYYDSKGVSLILIGTNKGNELFKSITELSSEEIDGQSALLYNVAFKRSVYKPSMYSKFWKTFLSTEFQHIPFILKKVKPTLNNRIKNKILCIIPSSIRNFIKSKIK